MEVTYLTLILLVNIDAFIVGGIVYSSKSWSRFKRTHPRKIADVLRDLRATEMPLMITGLIEYIDQERRHDKRLRIGDILSHGYPDHQLRILAPHLRNRELIGECNIHLTNMSTSTISLARISIVFLLISSVSVALLLFLLAIFAETLTVYWYAAPGTLSILALVIGLSSLAGMHIAETRFGARIEELQAGGIGSVHNP